MLSYPIDEAQELLESKLKTAKTSLSNCEEDLDFIREQITVSKLPRPGSLSRVGTDSSSQHRLWRWLRHEYTIGRLCRSEKKRRKRKIQKRLALQTKSNA